jgi:isopenicillin N synthase-like dioxygenase
MQVLKIDLKDENIGQKLVQSFRETGFAVISGHSVPGHLLASTYEDWEQFFERPMEQKLKLKYKTETQAGYFPPKEEKAKDATEGDLKEFYHWYPKYEYGSEGKYGPGGYAYGSRSSTDWLRDELVALSEHLLKAVESELLDAHSFEFKSEMLPSKMCENSERTLLRILHYPPLSSFSGSDQFLCERASAHEDINLITLLPAATNPGLQVKDVQGNWHTIDTDPGDIVVNVGDMLQEATGGYLPSTTHRVVADNRAMTQSRYSMPLFLHPRPEVRLSAKYTADEYLFERLRQLGLIK